MKLSGRRAGPGLAALVVLSLLAGGCAARKAYRQGKKESKAGNWDAAVANLTKALQKDLNEKVLKYNAMLSKKRVKTNSSVFKDYQRSIEDKLMG